MSEFTEEIPGQIAALINRIGDGEYTHTSIYPLPPEAAYDETIYPDEWIQTTGLAPDRLTVEIRRLDPDAMFRVYTLGHAGAAEQSAETEPIYNGEHKYLVRPAEVLTAAEAIGLFQHYYDHHGVPAGWHLREQPEFTIPAADTTTPAQPAADVSTAQQAGSAAAAAHDETQPGPTAEREGRHQTGVD